ncbi:MAG: orotidine 5'-phosphate decarboxylase [Nitrosopumilaceae archaeon]|nr:orotidine 5'-phosphate decarboxylase [Nitrosopumilaceae archaeon]NIT99483.1 orotidine 5'-phosphate decarboxylase [Nitrosopumilaceae archaeon]NIU85842.1 orotidine 5'-phosphate decarboxylase [Nitrosopumilaceae archaeon]NIV64699.1 orotidine 5'-phosphate decarboxylase [Nitrosopumilaceae archaeon]NIX60086.1 orotidine 5'-phosphate decarboxylase [Nitrosopumilaceae archaeon]
MAKFKTSLDKLSKKKGRLILANDYDDSTKNLEKKTISNIKKFHDYIVAIKLNFHLLLPLGSDQISKINKTAHKHKILSIADIKLNDIGNTNKVTTERLWELGFDAVIVNPMMGLENYRNLIKSTHRKGKGIISLCHMSAPQAKLTYDMEVKYCGKKIKVYQLFLEWAVKNNADGIIVGATFPKVIRYCKSKTKEKVWLVTPGVGTQGGDAKTVLNAGSDFLIVGRTILNSKTPVTEAKKLQELTLR